MRPFLTICIGMVLIWAIPHLVCAKDEANTAIVEAKDSSPPKSEDLTLTKTVIKARDNLWKKSREARNALKNALTGSIEIDRALKKLQTDPKNPALQAAFLDELIKRSDEIRNMLTVTDGAKLHEALLCVIKGYEELALWNEKQAQEAMTRAKNEESKLVKEWYVNLAETMNRCARAYKNDIERHKGLSINTQVSELARQMEYLNFFHKILLNYKSQLELLNKDVQLIKSLEDLGKCIEELNGYLKKLSEAILAPDLLPPEERKKLDAQKAQKGQKNQKKNNVSVNKGGKEETYLGRFSRVISKEPEP